MAFNPQLFEFLGYIILLILLVIAIILLVFAFISNIYSNKKGSPFVSNDNNVIKTALNLAQTSSNDTLIDIGSGDGRVLRIGVKDFDVKKAIGYEIAPLPYYVSRFKNWFFCKSNCLRQKDEIQIYKKDIMQVDLSNATVIYIYLFPEFSKKITPYLVKLLKKNKDLRIVSVSFPLNEKIVKPKKKSEEFHRFFRKNSEIFLYTKDSITN